MDIRSSYCASNIVPLISATKRLAPIPRCVPSDTNGMNQRTQLHTQESIAV